MGNAPKKASPPVQEIQVQPDGIVAPSQRTMTSPDAAFVFEGCCAKKKLIEKMRNKAAAARTDPKMAFLAFSFLTGMMS